MTHYSYFEFRWSRVTRLRNSCKMITFFIVFFTLIAVLAAVILRAYFNQVIPEGLPEGTHIPSFYNSNREFKFCYACLSA